MTSLRFISAASVRQSSAASRRPSLRLAKNSSHVLSGVENFPAGATRGIVFIAPFEVWAGTSDVEIKAQMATVKAAMADTWEMGMRPNKRS